MSDQERMYDLFARSRREPEPVWTPDIAAIAVGGRRRRRLRAVAVGGGAAGALAVTAVVVIGLGGITIGSSASPGTTRPRSTSVFDYASISLSTSNDLPAAVLPVSAVDKMSALIDALDPDHAHLRSMRSAYTMPALQFRMVGDGNSAVKGINSITASSVYTASGTVPARGTKAPNGSLSVTIAATANGLGRTTYTAPDVSIENIPCGYMLQDAFQSTPPEHPAHWSQCTTTQLPDGSKVDSSSTPDGDGTVSVAIREYPNNAGGIVVTWSDYPSWKTTLDDPTMGDHAPDPSVVLKPNPFSEQQLAAALSDPGLGPSGKAKPVGHGPKQFLKMGDLGADASYNPSSSSGSTGDLPMDNGCDYKDVNPLAKSGRTATYTVTTPGGKKVTVNELEYPLAPGTGPATMATARSQAQGGCDQQAQLYSKDTAKNLPTGIGDEAFVENGVGTGAVTVWMRFGDTILRVDVTHSGSMPDLSAPADQAWLANVARAAAAHWTAKD
ncbi:MAG: hypothetical protein HOV87_28515 [Catenulispora sp.]|nr:hypothetical protein [Catenulispora sp.]